MVLRPAWFWAGVLGGGGVAERGGVVQAHFSDHGSPDGPTGVRGCVGLDWDTASHRPRLQVRKAQVDCGKKLKSRILGGGGGHHMHFCF